MASKKREIDDLRVGQIILIRKACAPLPPQGPPSFVGGGEWWQRSEPDEKVVRTREVREIYGLPFRVEAIDLPYIVLSHPLHRGQRVLIDSRFTFEWQLCSRRFMKALLKGEPDEPDQEPKLGPDAAWDPSD